MKKLLCALILSIPLLQGCKPDNAPQYDPPQNIGTGTLLIFSAGSRSDYDSRFNEYMALHPEYRVVSQRELDGGGYKWLVVVEPIQAPVVHAAPTTSPFVDPNR